MSKDVIFSLIRTILTGLGAFLVGKNLLGTSVDANLWQGIIGAIVAVVSSVWGYLDKTNGIEGLQSALRSLLIIFGGLFVAPGKISADTLNAITGIATAIIPFILSALSKKKTAKIAAGELIISTSDTGKVSIIKPA